MDRDTLGFICLNLILILLHLIFVSRATADLNSDRQSLLAFAASVHHGRKLNWNSSEICSSWIGVTCSADRKRVISLRLPGMGLSGPIPLNALGKLSALEVLSLRFNRFVGAIPPDCSSLPTLSCLNLDNNSFDGSMPNFLSSNLTVLDLSFNLLAGQIPASLENLTELTVLSLQGNSFTGPIPHINLTKLRHLNLSNNNLSGSIPLSLQKFPISSFIGNPHLCGMPLAQCSDTIPSPLSPSLKPPFAPLSHRSSRKKPETLVIVVISVGGLVILILVALVFCWCLCKKNKEDGSRISKNNNLAGGRSDITSEIFGSGTHDAEKNKLSFFGGYTYNFDLEDLLRASAEVLGKGSYGTAYKAVLQDETIVMVKRLKEVLVGKREFEQHMDMIGNITQHPNVLPLRAYYYSKDEKLMVYDYVPGGSLYNALHGDNGNENGSLDWESRLKVAVAAARGVAHIHSEVGGKLVHGNIKSSNVLLLEGSTACISDFGLASIMNAPSTLRKMVGYCAPELIESRKPTLKSDVYGFGVLLLEMLTGKAPQKSPSRDDIVDLPRWVYSVVHEEWTGEVFDIELMKQPNTEEEMVRMLQIAMACVEKLPDQRPDMANVLRMIEEIGQESKSVNMPSPSSLDRPDHSIASQ